MLDECRPHFNRIYAVELYFKDLRTLVINENTRYDRYEAGIFDYRLHNGACEKQCSTSGSLRLQHTSSTLRQEYRDQLLSSTTFKFERPAVVAGFLTSLTPREKSQLRLLSLNISDGYDDTTPRGVNAYNRYLGWKWVCGSLPPNLTSITIDTMRMWILRSWMRVGHPSRFFPARTVMDVFLDVQCMLLTIDAICKETKACSPNARFKLGLAYITYEACFRAVMAEYN